MSAVGQSIITANGIKALMDASAAGKLIKPKYFKFSDTDYTLDPTIENISGWIQKDISVYNTLNSNTVEFICDVAPEEAAKYTKTAGLYLDDGTLFMLAKPPYPFPPLLRQTFKIQLVYQNAENLIDFSYLPFYETEQDLAILNNAAAIGELALQTSENIGMLQISVADYYKFKQETEQKLSEEAIFNVVKQNAGEGSGLDADLVRGLAADFSSLKETRGYQRLPGGLVLQWGYAANNTGSDTGRAKFTYPVPFENAILSYIVTSDKTDPDSLPYFCVIPEDVRPSLTEMEIKLVNYDNTAHASDKDGVRVFVIGF